MIVQYVVIYHANCNDGFCAAWLYWRAVGRQPDLLGAGAVEYVSAQYGDNPPDVRGKHVLIFDFSYDRAALQKMHSEAATLRVFDHHKTAQEELEGLDYCTFDMKKSGARLAQEFLGEGDNWLVDYTEDRDLWWWQLPSSQEVSAGLMSYPRMFKTWEQLFQRGMPRLREEGSAILRYQETLVRSAVTHPGRVKILEYEVPAVNTNGGFLLSEIVGALAADHQDAPFAAGFFMLPGGATVYSLRAHGNFDVSAVAKKMGGGGHPGAAGFKVGAPFPFWKMPENK